MVPFKLFDCRGKRLRSGFLSAAVMLYRGLSQALPAPLTQGSFVKNGYTSRLLLCLPNAYSHNLYTDLEWPDEIDGGWLAPDLMSIHGTHFEDEFSDERKAELAKWEWFTAVALFRVFSSGTKFLTFNQRGRSHG